jgi:hypothetical protein
MYKATGARKTMPNASSWVCKLRWRFFFMLRTGSCDLSFFLTLSIIFSQSSTAKVRERQRYVSLENGFISVDFISSFVRFWSRFFFSPVTTKFVFSSLYSLVVNHMTVRKVLYAISKMHRARRPCNQEEDRLDQWSSRTRQSWTSHSLNCPGRRKASGWHHSLRLYSSQTWIRFRTWITSRVSAWHYYRQECGKRTLIRVMLEKVSICRLFRARNFQSFSMLGPEITRRLAMFMNRFLLTRICIVERLVVFNVVRVDM